MSKGMGSQALIYAQQGSLFQYPGLQPLFVHGMIKRALLGKKPLVGSLTIRE